MCARGVNEVLSPSLFSLVLALSLFSLFSTSLTPPLNKYFTVLACLLGKPRACYLRAVVKRLSSVPLTEAFMFYTHCLVSFDEYCTSLFQLLYEPASTLGLTYALLHLLVLRNLAVLFLLLSQLCWNLAPFISIWLLSELFSTVLFALGILIQSISLLVS